MGKNPKTKVPKKKINYAVYFKNNWQLYVLILPAIIYFIVFNYMPLYGIQIAFKDFKAVFGISGSKWVGFKHFENFFHAYYFKRLLANTLLLNVYNLLWSFPVPIILAILLNQIKGPKINFISTVVLAGMLYIFLSPTSGIFNILRQALGMKSVDFMSDAKAFRTIYIVSGIWQSAGWGTILYIASLSGVDPSLYEAAEIDGASIWQKIRYIDMPSIVPVIVMVFILDCGKLLSSNTDKALVMQTAGNIPTSDIIGVYVYNVGLGSGQFSYTTAIGLFINIINFIIIITANQISKKISDVGLF